MPILPYTSFQDRFRAAVRSPTLGVPRRERLLPGTISPAAKDIQRIGVRRRLEDSAFLRATYGLGQQYVRLVRGQEDVRAVERRVRPLIKQHADVAKSLLSVERRLDGILTRAQRAGVRTVEIFRARDAVHDAACRMVRDKGDLTSTLHRSCLKPGDNTGMWEPILKEYDYDLASLKTKAPDQRLWEELDRVLRNVLVSNSGEKCSDMTRYVVIAVLLESMGRGKVEPAAIKMHLARKSQALNEVAKWIGEAAAGGIALSEFLRNDTKASRNGELYELAYELQELKSIAVFARKTSGHSIQVLVHANFVREYGRVHPHDKLSNLHRR